MKDIVLSLKQMVFYLRIKSWSKVIGALESVKNISLIIDESEIYGNITNKHIPENNYGIILAKKITYFDRILVILFIEKGNFKQIRKSEYEYTVNFNYCGLNFKIPLYNRNYYEYGYKYRPHDFDLNKTEIKYNENITKIKNHKNFIIIHKNFKIKIAKIIRKTIDINLFNSNSEQKFDYGIYQNNSLTDKKNI